VAMQDKETLDSYSPEAFQNKSLTGCFLCYVFAVKKMKFETNLVF